MLKKLTDITISLIGNPNVGKSTLFNALVGARQHVGNWPGKTVEKKEGQLIFENKKITVVDLPGLYSLIPYSEEEAVASDFITQAKSDVVVQIVDSQNLIRNLFLSLQLIEAKAPLVLALNMVDLAAKDGIKLETAKLANLLAVNVVLIDAKKKTGIDNLMRTILEMTALQRASEMKFAYGMDINARYNFIHGLARKVVKKNKKNKKNISDRIDDIVTNKFFGIPLFLVVAWSIFQAAFKLSQPLISWIESFFIFLANALSPLLIKYGFSAWFKSLLIDGIMAGVGGVLVFVPTVGILFLLIAFLEDSGYLARVAYLTDKYLHKIGLHGKAFIPLVVGFGCNVPGIMATRILKNKKDKLLTILISPFMSCSARLPVYVLFTGIFFSAHQGLVIFSLYLLGIIVAILAGLIFKKALFKGLSSPFVIELPPYRFPTFRGLFFHAWERVAIFIKKAGTIILAFSVIIWALASLPVGVEYGAKDSIAGNIGQVISPIFKPLGFSDWRPSMALIFGVVAKEVVVSSFGTLYGVGSVGSQSVGSNSLGKALQRDFTPLSAYAFLVFVLLYVPCMATIATIRRELNSTKWALFTVAYTITTAWFVSLLVYQGGKLLGFQ